MLPLIIIGTFILLILVVAWTIYNRLVQAKNLIDEAFSGIDVQLKKRYELIPNLIEAVKGYNAHEAFVLQKIVEERSASGKDVNEMHDNDRSITGVLKSFRVQVEAYPELKANTQFLKLMEQLSLVENELAMARRYYNGTTRDFNTKVQVFPAILFASLFGFKPQAFYQIEDIEKQAPEITL